MQQDATDTETVGDKANGPKRWRRFGVIGLLVALALIVAFVGVLIATKPNGQPEMNQAQRSLTVAQMLEQHPFLIAHRGGSADWPEMSVTAYTQAVSLGVDALEVSVARTRDGVFFGLHDRTLDRTSKISGQVDPTTLEWADLKARYKNKLNSTDPAGEDYTPVSDVFGTFAASRVIFVDTKYIGDQQQRTDLINLMLSYAPADHWVLKGYYTDAALAHQARQVGIQSWGYYYARDLTNLESTSSNWDMLGLELAATPAQWSQVTSKGKPTIAFFITGPADLEQAVTKGADGMMVSGVRATLGVRRPVQSP